MATAPYNTRGTPDTSNNQDNIYSQSGRKTLLNLTQNRDGTGYSAAIAPGVQTLLALPSSGHLGPAADTSRHSSSGECLFPLDL